MLQWQWQWHICQLNYQKVEVCDVNLLTAIFADQRSEMPSEFSRLNFIYSHENNMLSSYMKRSPWLWLHNKLRLFHWCLYNKQNITCPLVDMNFVFECSLETRIMSYKMRLSSHETRLSSFEMRLSSQESFKKLEVQLLELLSRLAYCKANSTATMQQTFA